MVSQPAPPPRSTLLQVESERQQPTVPLSTSPLPPSYVSLDDEWGSGSSGDKSNESNYSLFTATGSPDSTQDVPVCIPDSASTGPSDNKPPESKSTSSNLKQNIPCESIIEQLNIDTSTVISVHKQSEENIQQGQIVINEPLRDMSTAAVPTTQRSVLNKKQKQVELVASGRGLVQLHPNFLKTTSNTRSRTLERCIPKPPSSNPPSLPGSIDRKTWQHQSTRTTLERLRPGSRPGTLDRKLSTTQSNTLEARSRCGNRHGSFSGSRQGTLERKTPPLPTSQPPPIPTTTAEETTREHNNNQQPFIISRSNNNIGQMAGKLELVDLIPGVPRHVLTEHPIPITSHQHENGASGPINVRRKERKLTLKKGYRNKQ